MIKVLLFLLGLLLLPVAAFIISFVAVIALCILLAPVAWIMNKYIEADLKRMREKREKEIRETSK